MQAVEIVLLIVVAALALSLLAYLVVPRLRPSTRAIPTRVADSVRGGRPAELVCPTCGREYPAGLKYCPTDARALVPTASGAGPGGAAGGLTCPVCRRSFDGSKKYCPYDAEELTQSAPRVPRSARSGPPGLAHVLGKICPHCSKRYESEATFCGRDGSELVPIN
jgi:predicted amidophosphoribosyltransferase